MSFCRSSILWPWLMRASLAAAFLGLFGIAGCGGGGSACSVTDNGDGTATLACDDGTSFVVTNGAAGMDGTSCTVADNGDGTSTVSCADGTTAVIRNGKDVTLVANEACMTCHESGSIVGVQEVHLDPLDLADPSADIVITSVDATDNGDNVDFAIHFDFTVTVSDGYGNETAVNPFTPRATNPAELEFLRFFIGRHVPAYAGTGSPDTWTGYVTGERLAVNLVDNGGGSYTYTANVLDADMNVAYDAAATYRAGIQAYNMPGFKVVNPLFDFRPDAGSPLASHEVANIASCNECHGEYSHHGGGRVETGMCVMCHNEVDRPAVDLPVLVHKVHSAKLWDTDRDYTHVTFPQDPRNCQKCHNGADVATPEGDNWMDVPNRKACGACHDDVDFVTGTNHPGGIQTTDQNCSGCHSDVGIAAAHRSDDPTPENPDIHASLSAITYVLDSAAVDGSNVLTINFQILRDGAPLDILALPADLTTSTSRPSFLAAWALPQGNNMTPADYNNIGNTGGLASSFSLGTLITNAAIADAGAGTFTATIADAFPVGATMRAVALQGYFAQTADLGDGMGVRDIARHTPSKVVAVTGDVARRVIVDNDKCASCHDELQLHGGNRVYETGVCLTCHTTANTSSGRAADPTTLPTELVAVLGSDPMLYPEQPMNLKDLVHSAHGSGLRQRDFEFVRNRNGGIYYDFAEITFPGILQNCETCHKPGTYVIEDIPMSVLPTTARTTCGDGETRAELLVCRSTVPNDTDLASSPIATTCYGCHAADATEAHIEANGGIIAEPRLASGLD